jgi:hypothetical protein
VVSKKEREKMIGLNPKIKVLTIDKELIHKTYNHFSTLICKE